MFASKSVNLTVRAPICQYFERRRKELFKRHATDGKGYDAPEGNQQQKQREESLSIYGSRNVPHAPSGSHTTSSSGMMGAGTPALAQPCARSSRRAPSS